jgi:hypothetical protein
MALAPSCRDGVLKNADDAAMAFKAASRIGSALAVTSQATTLRSLQLTSQEEDPFR